MGIADVSSQQADDLNGNPRPGRAVGAADAECRPGLSYDDLEDTAPMRPPPWSCVDCGVEDVRLYGLAGEGPLRCASCADQRDVLAHDVVLP